MRLARTSPDSLKAALPYYQVLEVRLDQHEAPASVVLLKDGALVMGLRTTGLDVGAASYAQIDQQGAEIAQALSNLPIDAFVQMTFSSGGSFDDLLQRFAQQGAADAHPLLQRGRAAQARMYQVREGTSRRDIIYWVGWRGFTQGWAAALKAGGAGNLEKIRKVAGALARHAEKFRTDMELAGLELSFMHQQATLDVFHRAVNPNAHVGPLVEGLRFVENQDDVDRWRRGAPMVIPGFSVSSQLPLSCMRIRDTHVVMGDPPMLGRALGVLRLGPSTSMEALHALMYSKCPDQPFRLAVSHQRTDRQLKREALGRQRRNIVSLGLKVLDSSAAARAAIEESHALGDNLEMGEVQAFDTSITVWVTGRDHTELDESTRLAIEAMAKEGIVLSTLVDEQLQGWLATLPANGRALPARLTVTDVGAAHLTPHWLPSTGDATPDVLLSNRQQGVEGLSVRVGAGREHAGAVIVGGIGSGKTFLFWHLIKYGILSLGGHVVIVDKKGAKNSSLKPQCDAMGGAFFSVAGATDISFNIFPLRAEALDGRGKVKVGRATQSGRDDDALDVMGSVTTLLLMMAYGAQKDETHSIIKEKVARDIIDATYAATVDKSGPILEDAVRACDDLIFEDDPNRDELLTVASEIKKNLHWGWIQNESRAALFNRPGHVDLHNRLTIYDFFGCEQDPQVEDVMVASLSLRVAAKMEALGRAVPKAFGADEYWASSPGVTNMVHRLGRLQRSFGFCVLLLTQRYEDIANSIYGDGILGATSMIYLMTHMDGHAYVADKLDLNERSLDLFKSLRVRVGKYAEMMLVERESGGTGKARVVRFEPSALDLWWGTSRPADVVLRDAYVARHGGDFSKAVIELAARYPQGAPSHAETEHPA